MNISVRPYQADDLPRLTEITVEAFQTVSIDQNIEKQVGGPINGRDWRWRKAKQIEEDARRDPGGLFVAQRDGKIIGYVTTWHDPEAGIGYIPNLAVSRQCRGQGIGRKLIAHALDHFRRLGLKYARIETLEQNPIGQKLYPSVGFREVARQIHYGMPLEG